MILLENEALAISFHDEGGWITGLFDKRRQLEFVADLPRADAFRIELESGVSADFEQFYYDRDLSAADGEGFNFTWEIKQSLKIKGKVRLSAGNNELHFFCEVFNQSTEAVIGLEYPIIPNLHSITDQGQHDYVAHSFATGFRIHNPMKHFQKDGLGFRYMPYPESFSGSSMQFFTYYGMDTGGLYFAALDGECYAKWLNFYKNENDLLEAAFIHGCEDIGSGRGFKVEYPVVIKTLQGQDWYEAADIYKEWAEQQFWCRKGKLSEASENDKCGWLLEEMGVSTFGINAGHDRSEWLHEYHKHLQTPIFHILGPDWPAQKQTFGSGVPGGYQDWFPTKFNQANLRAMKSWGDKYAPFEFDYLFNVNGADGELGKKALQNIPDPPKSIDKYRFPLICPADSYVQDLHVRRDETLAKEVNVDSIYYDISANNIMKVCMDESHGHPKGAGRQITLAYRDNYIHTKEAMRRAADRYIPMGTEMMNEVFLDVLDYYQARAGAQPAAPLEGWNIKELLKSGEAELIPMFTYVYHEYGPVRLDGWGKLVEEIGSLFYFTVARTYLWGGLYELNYEYSPMEALEDGKENDPEEHYYVFEPKGYRFAPERARYISRFAKMRTGAGNKYLAYGTMLKPLEFECEAIELDWYHYNHATGSKDYNTSGRLTVDCIVHAAWQYQDQSLGYFFANVSDESKKVRLSLDMKRYRLTQNQLWVRRITGDDEIELFSIKPDEERDFEFSIPEKNVVMIEIL